MTNAEKFEEVFGFKPDPNACVLYVDCKQCKYDGYYNCSYNFWDEEYKENKE